MKIPPRNAAPTPELAQRIRRRAARLATAVLVFLVLFVGETISPAAAAATAVVGFAAFVIVGHLGRRGVLS